MGRCYCVCGRANVRIPNAAFYCCFQCRLGALFSRFQAALATRDEGQDG